MRLLSVNIGKIVVKTIEGEEVETGLYKQPVSGRVNVLKETLEGDIQVNTKYHGGPYQAVYAYDVEHYGYWRHRYGDIEFNYGFFGENLTTEGMLDHEVRIGSIYRIGTAELQVTKHRMPCNKLVHRSGLFDFYEIFLESWRLGIYFSVIKPGEIQEGDTIDLLKENEEGISVKDYAQLLEGRKRDKNLLKKVLKIPSIDPRHRNRILTSLIV